MSRFDLSAVFPKKDDPRHPPLWLWRAIVWIMLAVFIFLFISDSISKLAELISVVLIAVFFGMALEPGMNFFAKHGINKKLATLITIFISLGIIVGAIMLFGSILLEQLVQLFNTAPSLYKNIQEWLLETLNLQIPNAPDAFANTVSQYADTISKSAIDVSFGFFGAVINLLAMILIMYYMCSSGDKFRETVASFLEKDRQRDFIRVFIITQTKIGSFLGSRLILAIISIVFVSVVGIIMQIPYWLPLAIFMGVVGQFVPTVGVYVGGALPVIVTLASKGPLDAIIMLVILIIYQNIENMLIMPKVSQEALDLNPATAFISVLAFGYIWGPVGAFLALPVVASIVTILKVVLKRYELEDIELIANREKKNLSEKHKSERTTKSSKQTQ